MLYDPSKYVLAKNANETQQVGIICKNISDIIRTQLQPSFAFTNADILLGNNDIERLETKHPEEFSNYFEQIPIILAKPDFIGIHPSGQSIEFIKQFDENVLVAVRMKNKNPLWIRSCYKISDTKLQNYKANGRIVDIRHLYDSEKISKIDKEA